jgi:2-iminobutanoate/2-iminopropanoate deaminase
MKKLSCIPFLLIVLAGFSQKTASNVQFLNPSSVAPPKGYSHAAVIDLGNCQMLLLSGQVSLDKLGNLVGKDNIEKQTEQVFLNIKTIVELSGGTIDNIVKLGYFVTDVSQIQSIRNVRDRFINTKNPPASTLVQVSKLFRDDILIEIEATAIIPKN